MFDWTAEITGTGDRSEFKLETVLEKNYLKLLLKIIINEKINVAFSRKTARTILNIFEDTVIEALVLTTVSLLC